MRVSLVSILVDDPVKAHKFYTKVLGFKSKRFEPEALLAIVSSPDGALSTDILLEPRGEGFAKDFQTTAYESDMPVIIFGADDPEAEMERLGRAGVVLRPDLANPEWEMEHLFEDTCGNIIMLQKNEG